MRTKRQLIGVSACIAALICGSTASAGMVFGFGAITNNSIGNPAIAEAQMTVEVFDAGLWTEFKFRNAGPLASFISDIYFDDGSLVELLELQDSDDTEPVDPFALGDPDVDFSPLLPNGGNVPNLPAGENANPDFIATEGFAADNDPGAANGVHPGEWLSIFFTRQGGQSTNDVLNELASGALRIGIHVQGIDGPNGESSESLVNNPEPIPAPGAFVLGLLGVSAVSFFRRRVA